MTTTAKGIVPQAKATTKKPLSKAHETKLVSGLEKWRARLPDEERAELAERTRQRPGRAGPILTASSQ